MQFSAQSTAALAMLFLALPALSEPLRMAKPTETTTTSVPTGSGKPFALTPQVVQNNPALVNSNVNLNQVYNPDNIIHHPVMPKKNHTRPHGHPNWKGPGNKGNDGNNKNNGAKLVQALKAYHDQVDQEFDQCVKENGINKCLSRINGPMPKEFVFPPPPSSQNHPRQVRFTN
jgi:hypothetical protein